MNCPNCGAIIKTSDKYCEYCGTQNSFSIEDVMKTGIFCDGYVAEKRTVYEDVDVYYDIYGRLHRSKVKPKRIITIIEK